MTDTLIGYGDFQDFRIWYKQRRRRDTGRLPSEKTLRTKTVNLVRCARDTGCRSEVELADVLTDAYRTGRLLEEVSERVSPGSARLIVWSLLNFAQYAVERGWLASVEGVYVTPADMPAKNPQKAIQCYSAEEMELFVSAARGVDLRWWALITFLVDSGRRIGETLDIEFGGMRLDETPAYVEFPHTKNGEAQYVPLTRRLREEVFTPQNLLWLKTHERGGRHAFSRPKEWFPFPWHYSAVHGRFERFCERTGLPNRGFHNFRHTVITERIARGVPIQAVSKLAGHSSIAVTDGRYHHATALSYAGYIEREGR